jgi:hypothetical protein
MDTNIPHLMTMEEIDKREKAQEEELKKKKKLMKQG